ncbi:Nucleoporin-like 2, partial [Apaloderma vittatum]
GTSRGGGGWDTSNSRYANVIQPSAFKSNTWGGSGDHGRGFLGSLASGSSGNRNADFSQNRFSVLTSSPNVADSHKDEEERLLEGVVKDMEIWESSGQWIFSSYSPMKDKPNVSGFTDLSPEEMRLEYYNCRANNNIQNYINSVQQLAEQWKNRVRQLKALNAPTKAALLSELRNVGTQPLPSFGCGGQQTPSFGLSSFPVKSSSTSASSFSFKTSSSLTSGSAGNTPAFGSSSVARNPPAFGGTSSPSVSHSVGLGSSAAPSAASFSFKTSETTSAFGTSGFSGFGSSAAVNAAGNAPLTALAASNATVTNNTTTEKLFTPMSELSAEELKQFEAKRFTLGKIPLKPPPLELL